MKLILNVRKLLVFMLKDIRKVVGVSVVHLPWEQGDHYQNNIAQKNSHTLVCFSTCGSGYYQRQITLIG